MIVAVVAAAFSGEARAACYRQMGADDLRVLDLDGLPTNAALLVPHAFDDERVRIEMDGHADVELVERDIGAGVTARFADEALPSSTSLRVCAADDACAEGTTAADFDFEAPPAPIVSVDHTEGVRTLDGECGDLNETDVTFAYDVDADDLQGLLVEVDAGDEATAHAVIVPRAHGTFGDERREAGRAVYAVRAVDYAGNVSGATFVDVDLGCEGSCAQADGAAFAALAALLGVPRARRRR